MPEIYVTIDLEAFTSKAIRALEQAAPVLEPAIAARELTARRSGAEMTKAELAEVITRLAVVPFTGNENKAELIESFTKSMVAQIPQAKQLAELQEAVRADRRMANHLNTAIEDMREAHEKFLAENAKSPFFLGSNLQRSSEVAVTIDVGRIARRTIVAVNGGEDIRDAVLEEVRHAVRTTSYVPQAVESGIEEKLINAAAARMFLRHVAISYGFLTSNPMTVDVGLLD